MNSGILPTRRRLDGVTFTNERGKPIAQGRGRPEAVMMCDLGATGREPHLPFGAWDGFRCL
jgi:hypothetical protein